jgi:hypothetical protein
MKTHHLTLIGCCAEKLGRIAPARELYRSALFRKAAQWASQQRHDWHVLSAAYGLIKPDSQLAPYDCAMASLKPEARQAWAKSVAMDIDALTTFYGADRLEITLLAGQDYAGWVPLVEAWCTVHQPMQGMQIGQRLQWLNQQLEQPVLFEDVAA